jgi:hypothetical protein
MFRKLSILSAIIGAGLATAAAGAFLSQQASFNGSSVFPMPFFALFDWAVLGIAGAVYLALAELRPEDHQTKGAWAVLGAYLPLIVLGALSIGSIALVSAAFLLVPVILHTIRYRVPFLRQLGFLLIGAVINLAFLGILIFFSR